jgi:type IV pilus assembly protein PilC
MLYRYEAKDESGKTVSGTLEADTEQSAATLVRQMGYFPMRFSTHSRGGAATLDVPLSPTKLIDQTRTPTRTVGDYKEPFSTLPYGNWFQRNLIYPVSTGVSSKDLAIFFREFAAMLQAGVPITRCLDAISENHRSGNLGVAIRGIKRRIESGDTLSNAFGEFPHIFSELNRAMISAGEESGGLDLMLLRISEYLEKEFALREMIKRETFMAKIELAASIFLPPLYVWVVSGWMAYFHQVVEPTLQISALLVMLFCAVKISFRSKFVRLTYDTIKAYLPWFGGTVRMLALAKFARAFASLYAAGVLIPRALEVAAKTTGNTYFSEKIAKATEALVGGATLSQALGTTGSFPPIFLSMVNTGETTGSLDAMLSKVADFYDGEAETRIHAVVKSIPVILLIIMGIVVLRILLKFWSGYGAQMNGIMNDNG